LAVSFFKPRILAVADHAETHAEYPVEDVGNLSEEFVDFPEREYKQ
jgi:hypothetical protein